MSLQDDRESQRRRKPDPEDEPVDNKSSRKKRAPAGDVGRALRSAYQRMIDEDIPPEMLDLLGKLG